MSSNTGANLILCLQVSYIYVWRRAVKGCWSSMLFQIFLQFDLRVVSQEWRYMNCCALLILPWEVKSNFKISFPISFHICAMCVSSWFRWRTLPLVLSAFYKGALDLWRYIWHHFSQAHLQTYFSHYVLFRWQILCDHHFAEYWVRFYSCL